MWTIQIGAHLCRTKHIFCTNGFERVFFSFVAALSFVWQSPCATLCKVYTYNIINDPIYLSHLQNLKSLFGKCLSARQIINLILYARAKWELFTTNDCFICFHFCFQFSKSFAEFYKYFVLSLWNQIKNDEFKLK